MGSQGTTCQGCGVAGVRSQGMNVLGDRGAGSQTTCQEWEPGGGATPMAWLPQEGVCILTGLGFNGLDEYGTAKWDACANMKVWLFETTPRFTGTIASFNINTNAWVAR